MIYPFFAIMARMKYIERWALMNNARSENLSEHCLETAMITHVLCTLARIRYNKDIDANKAALWAMYHDAAEIITGDLPTPVKYFNQDIADAYKEVEGIANMQLLCSLPSDLQDAYRDIFFDDQDDANDAYARKLIKAADKISAYLKCIEEKHAGNHEFDTALLSCQKAVDKMRTECPEVDDFMKEFSDAYGRTLDELLKR